MVFTEAQINAVADEARVIEKFLASVRASKWRRNRKAAMLSHQWEPLPGEMGFMCRRCGISQLEAFTAISSVWCD